MLCNIYRNVHVINGILAVGTIGALKTLLTNVCLWVNCSEVNLEYNVAFLTYVFGGPDKLNDSKTTSNMRAAHKHLVEEKGLNEDHFNAVIENFVATLKELNVPEELIGEVGAIAAGEAHKNDVLNR